MSLDADTYGDGWNGGYVKLQKETSPGSGTYADVNFNGTPYAFLDAASAGNDINRKYYATDALPANATDSNISGPAGLRFEKFDADDPNFPGFGSTDYKGPISRFLDITPGGINYRIIVGNSGRYQG